MDEAYVVDAVRTPFGKRDGAFRDTHPQDLAAEPLLALERRNRFESADVEDVIYGCVGPVDEQGSNIGRLAPLVAGWGDSVPGVQLNRMYGSGQREGQSYRRVCRATPDADARNQAPSQVKWIGMTGTYDYELPLNSVNLDLVPVE